MKTNMWNMKVKNTNFTKKIRAKILYIFRIALLQIDMFSFMLC